jgi:hypothetical protein
LVKDSDLILVIAVEPPASHDHRAGSAFTADTNAAFGTVDGRVSHLVNLATQCVVCGDVAADQAGALVSRDSRAQASLPWFALI